MSVIPSPFPEPDHHSGYRMNYLKEIMGDDMYSEFVYWMRGQTVMKDLVTGQSVVYEHDVKRFLEGRPPLD